MRASKIQKARLTPKEINVIISSSGLLELVPFLKSTLHKSRKIDLTPVELFDLQSEIANQMIVFEKQIQLFKKTQDRSKQNDEWRSREIYKAQHRFLKQIMDGVAFRLLNFNRPAIRQMVEHKQTGHLSKGFVAEMEKAAYIVEKSGYYVVLNDLTNFLRHGDLTMLSPEGYLFDEVKASGKSSKGDQKRALDNLIKMLNEKVFVHGDQSAEYIKVPGKPTNFLSQVESVIEKSKELSSGIYAERIAPYLWVSSTYFPRIREYYSEHKDFPQFPKYPFQSDEISAPTNSLMFFSDFSPNIVPYSVFPFSEANIIDLMTGQIQLKVVLSEKELVKSLKGKGWELVPPDKKDIISIYDADDIDLIKEAVMDPKYFWRLSKGRFSYKVPREVILRIETEFRSAKALVDEAEHLMSLNGTRKTPMLTTDFEEERLIWI